MRAEIFSGTSLEVLNLRIVGRKQLFFGREYCGFYDRITRDLLRNTNLKKRDLYLQHLKAFQDTEMIKVITGIHCCGKPCRMKLMAEHLHDRGIADK